MLADEFARYSDVLYRLTVDFVRAVPDSQWHFTPEPPAGQGLAPRIHRPVSNGFAPFSKQLRHLVCVRGVYNAALMTKRVEWQRKHEHYAGPLTRDALLVALANKQRTLLALLQTHDLDRPIDWEGTPFSFALFTWEFVQHEALHHGQWSLYAARAGFATPDSWRSAWGL